MTRLRWIGGLAVLLLLAAGPARADLNKQSSDAAWKKADQCSHEAFKKYPDYTPAGNAQREAARRECLRNQKLPEPAPAPAAASGDRQ